MLTQMMTLTNDNDLVLHKKREDFVYPELFVGHQYLSKDPLFPYAYGGVVVDSNGEEVDRAAAWAFIIIEVLGYTLFLTPSVSPSYRFRFGSILITPDGGNTIGAANKRVREALYSETGRYLQNTKQAVANGPMNLACGYDIGNPNKTGFSFVLLEIATEAHGKAVNNYFRDVWSSWDRDEYCSLVSLPVRTKGGLPSKQTLLEDQGHKCAICFRRFNEIPPSSKSLSPWELDHILPISRGGEHAPNNVRVLCWQCNLSKSNKTDEEWLGVEEG